MLNKKFFLKTYSSKDIKRQLSENKFTQHRFDNIAFRHMEEFCQRHLDEVQDHYNIVIDPKPISFDFVNTLSFVKSDVLVFHFCFGGINYVKENLILLQFVRWNVIGSFGYGDVFVFPYFGNYEFVEREKLITVDDFIFGRVIYNVVDKSSFDYNDFSVTT